MSDEKVLDRKYDACMARLLVNSGIGASAGIILSVVLFRRRFWPIPFSVGFAAGMSFQECRQNFAPDSLGLPGHFVRSDNAKSKALVENKK